MRSRLQLELNPGDYQEAQKRERRALLEQLTAALDRAFSREEPWYMWVLARRNGEHQHDLQRDDGTPIACPVPGCDARRTLNVREAA
jgi:hypothetical protein